MPSPFPTLKEFYYLDHFLEMVAFVENHYGGVLGEAHRDYLQRFRALGREAQGLSVRMANRRGRIFRRETLRYPEIPDLPAAAAELAAAGFAREPRADDFADLVATLNRDEVLALVRKAVPESRGIASQRKRKLVALAVATGDFASLVEVGGTGGFLVQERIEDLTFLVFLYFGKLRDNLQAFALRDLGIVRARQGNGGFEPRFTDRTVAANAFFHARLRQRIRAAEEAELPALARGAARWPRGGDAETVAHFHEAVVRLGARLERAGAPDAALEVYALSDVYPATERTCRLRFANGDRDGVEQTLLRLIDDPSCDEEFLFADDFYRRKYRKERVGKLTALLRDSPVLEIDESQSDGAERAAVAHYRARGIDTHRAENHFWTALFGTYFWDELQVGCATPNAFEPRPTALLDGTFYARNPGGIEAALATIDPARVTRAFADHFGEPNGIFRWRKGDEAVLARFLEAAPPDAVAATLRRMARDFANTSSGYPDLVLFGPGGVKFVEIKAEGDQIRRHQLVQIQALQAAGFTVEVARIRWCVDPEQEYVVVDVETTGGKPSQHRLTEIGAVKVRGGEIVGRYQTLLNPRQKIPWFIVNLTGISDAMVAEAPDFADVADTFRAFVGDAVFVAHNAKFDYGFVRGEFARLGEDFRRPTLCTVVAMRRYYPGLKSYRLKNLCAAFEIPLEQHHRALHDAEATAGLLQLVNAKRIASTDR